MSATYPASSPASSAAAWPAADQPAFRSGADAVPAAPPVAEYLQTVVNTGDLSVYPMGTVNLGTPATDRKILGLIEARAVGTADLTLTGAKVGGVEVDASDILNIQNAATNSSIAAMIAVAVPDGATGAVELTFSRAATRAIIHMFRGTGHPLKPYDVLASVITDPGARINVPAGGFAIGAGIAGRNTTCAWTGLTEVSDQTVEAGAATVSAALEAFADRQDDLLVQANFALSLEDAGMFASWGTTAQPSVYVPYASPRPQVIYSLDIDSDVDDVAILVSMLNLEHQGLIDIKAMSITSANNHAAGCAYAINNYYGRTAIPMGVNTADPGSSSSLFTETVVDNYGVAGKLVAADFPSSPTVLRQALAEAADASIEWLVNGTMADLKLVMESAADGISALTGAQLVAAKVRNLWIADGTWPSGDATSDLGFDATRATLSAWIFANWPPTIPIIFAGTAQNFTFTIGGAVMAALDAANPARHAWSAYMGAPNVGNGRNTWGQGATMAIAYGVGPDSVGARFFQPSPPGVPTIHSSTGVTSWTYDDSAKRYFLRGFEPGPIHRAVFNALIIDVTAW